MLVSVLSYLLVHSTNVFGAAPCAGDDAGETEVSPALESSVQEERFENSTPKCLDVQGSGVAARKASAFQKTLSYRAVGRIIIN